jgi:hypothetical protein
VAWIPGAFIDGARRLKAWLTPRAAGVANGVDERGGTGAPVRRVNPITCPHCGATLPEVMESDVCVVFIYCRACHDKIELKPGDCCVFLSYGQQPCFHASARK